MKKEEELTMVKIEKGTREALKAIGKKGETYNGVIQKLLDLYHEVKRQRGEVEEENV